MTKEVWRTMPGYPGYYEISNMGRARGVDRIVSVKGQVDRKVKGTVLSPHCGRTGYLSVHLRMGDKKPRLVRLHRMVLEAFIGPCPKGMEVRHLNGDPADNRLSNLMYGTRSENMLDTVEHGTNYWAKKTQCPRGHALSSPNLKKSELKNGQRSCLACGRARSYVAKYKNRSNEFQKLADRYYESIIKEVSA